MRQIRAISLYSYLDVASSVGIDGLRLLAEEGISPLSLSDHEARLPASAAIRLLERSAEVSGLDSFGVRMAQSRSFASLGPLSLLLERLDDVGEVVNALSIFRRSFNDVLFISNQCRGDAVSVLFNFAPPHSYPQATDMAVGLGYLALVGASQHRWAPDLIHFTHSAPMDIVAFKRLFNAPMKFNEAFDGFTFARASLDIALPLADPLMAQNTRHLLNLMRAPVSDHTKHAASLLLPSGSASITNVAASLNRTPRTLRRQLANEGQTFTGMLNDLRRELAQEYVNDGQKDLASIAVMLGYSNHGAFARWFAREFGQPPSQWRKEKVVPESRDPDVIFSLKDGEVWANWLDRRPSVNLGTHDMVIAMMSDYIKQSDLAVRMLSGTLELI